MEQGDAERAGAGACGYGERGPAGAGAGGRWRAEVRATLALAWPLVLTNLSQVALTATDTLLLGRLSTEALAAATLGGALWWAALTPGFGVSFAAASMLARDRGAGRGYVRRMRGTLRASLHAGALVCVPAALLLWQAGPLLRALGQDPVLAALAGEYLRAMVWGMPFFVGYLVLRGFLAALERPRPALLVSLLGVALNAALGWLLVFGHAGLPALGAVGAGLASAASWGFMFAALAGFLALDRRLRRFRLAGRWWRPDPARLRDVARLGGPITGQLALEIGMFGASGLLVGLFGAVAVAAHAVALQVASAIFMIPLGLGQAATARVGLAAGALRPEGARVAGWTAIGLGAGAMTAAALLLLLAPGALAGLFLDPRGPDGAEAAALAATLLTVAGVFQLADGTQSVAGGALRGLGDARVPFVFAACGYWLLGLPAGWLLAVPLGLGPAGIWAGLAAGLALVATLMTRRWARLSRRVQSAKRHLALGAAVEALPP